MKLPNFIRKQPIEQSETPNHKHDWELLAKTFIEPKPINIPGSLELTQLSMTGMTTFLFQCTDCKEFKKEEVQGLETTTLDNMIDKVDISGPEYILKDGKTYILMRYVKQENLPVR